MAKWIAVGIITTVMTTIGTLVIGGVVEEIWHRIGFAPRNLVPESFLKPKPVPPEVKEAQQKPAAPKELETGSLKGTGALKDEAKRIAREKCQRAKAKRISEEEALVAAVDAEWKKCVKAAKPWPLFYGNAEAYCSDWQDVMIERESELESARGWSC
jgi:hypothetical protein